MKKIEAIIRPARITEVVAALLSIGIDGLTMTEVKGFAPSAPAAQYRGAAVLTSPLSALVKLEVAVADFKASQTVETVRRAARSGARDEGLVAVLPIDEGMRVRTGEVGEDAL